MLATPTLSLARRASKGPAVPGVYQFDPAPSGTRAGQRAGVCCDVLVTPCSSRRTGPYNERPTPGYRGVGDSMQDNQDQFRRGRLHQLDSLLDALERLNLSEATELPDSLRHSLQEVGIPVAARPDFSSLIERVWELQEQYLSPGMPSEAGPGAVRRGISG